MIDVVVAIVPVFVASVVECIEAWTVVVAVGLSRGWKAPLLGVLAALGVIGILVAFFGVTLVDRIDEHLFEVVIGTLLLLFGLRWMRKAVLRYVGVIAMHDEDVAYRKTVDELGRTTWERTRFDWVGFSISAKTMLLEGLEITFLVITLGASGESSYPVAIAGAVAAFVVVGVVGYSARGPLSNVPENTLKAFVSVMLCSFGVFWVAEGFGVEWSGDAWALVYLFAIWAALVVVLVRFGRARLAGRRTTSVDNPEVAA